MPSCEIHPPHTLLDQVRSTLHDDLSAYGRNVSFEIHEAEVVLRGVVGSYYHKQMVQESLRRIDGLSRITNQIQVVTR